VRAGQRAEELALDELLGQRRAVDLDERMRRARPVVVDELREEALPRAGIAREQDAHVERRDERDLFERLRQGRAAPDDAGQIQTSPHRPGGVCLVARPTPDDDAIEELCDVACERLGERAIARRERIGLGPPLQVEDPARRLGSDRRAHHRFDARAPYALALGESGIEQRRRRHDGLARRHRLGDHAPRHHRADALDLLRIQPVRDPPALRVRPLAVSDLQVSLPRPDSDGDRLERFTQQRLHVLVERQPK
jgi:hypothetical protein